MYEFEDLCYMLKDNIKQVIKKGDISPSEMDPIYKAVKSMYYIKVMDAMDEAKEYGYSGANNYGASNYGGYGANNYGAMNYGESSGRNRYGESSGRYMPQGGRSGENREDMKRHLEMALNDAKTEPERQMIMNCLQSL